MKSYAQLTMLGDEEPGVVVAQIAAIRQVEQHADPQWLAAALSIIKRLCVHKLYLTSDTVWAGLADAGIPAPREPRALGAVMRTAAKDGLIEPTGRYVASERVECHGRPIAIWKVK